MSHRFSLPRIFTVFAVALLSLASCAQATSPEDATAEKAKDQQSSISESAETSDEENKDLRHVKLPTCDAIPLNTFDVQDELRVEEEVSPISGNRRIGPIAQDTAQSAVQSRWCTVYLPDSEFIIHFGVFELTPNDSDAFKTTLDASDYTRSNVLTDVDAYLYLEQLFVEGEPASWTEVHHLFHEPLWFTQTQHQVGGEGTWPTEPSEAMARWVDTAITLNTSG